jgi:crossover junction endodeoxyribonuclease RuvC
LSIVLGIDPGSRVTGFGLIEKTNNAQLRYISSGCVRVTSTSLSEKLYTIFEGISQLMQEFNPDEVGIESIFMHRNAMSALKLGQARGVAIAAAAHYAAEVFEYSPREIKQAVVGYGAAEKAQVQSMVCRLLSLKAVPQADAADALAVALCHIHTQEGKKRLNI